MSCNSTGISYNDVSYVLINSFYMLLVEVVGINYYFIIYLRWLPIDGYALILLALYYLLI